MSRDYFEKWNLKNISYGPAYDLSKTSFFTESSVKNVAKSISLNDIKLLNGITEFIFDTFDNKYSFKKEDPHLFLSDKYRNLVKNTNLVNIGSAATPGNKLLVAKGNNNVKYKSYDVMYYTLDVDTNELNATELEAYNVLACINYWFAMQLYKDDNSICRNYSLDASVLDEDNASTKAFNTLIKDLNAGKLPIVCTSTHAVTAVSLYRDIKNPNIYYLNIYDNNHAGQITTLLISEEKTVFTVEDIAPSNLLDGLAELKNSYSYTVYDGNKTFATKADFVNIDFTVFNIAD